MKVKSKLQAILGILNGSISYERNILSLGEIYEKVLELNKKYKSESFCEVVISIGGGVDNKYSIYTPYTAHLKGNNIESLLVELEKKLSGKVKVVKDHSDKIIIEA